MKILLIEDEKITRITLTDTLSEEGYRVTACATGSEGLAAFQAERFDVLLTDLRLPAMSGIDILKMAKEKDPTCPVIVMTAYASVDTAVQALKLGAYDYLTKPFSPDELLALLDKIKQYKEVLTENIQLKNRIKSFEKRSLIGQSAVMRHLVSTLQIVAQNDFTVLIQGESGTGKEVAARFLHYHSPRRPNPFVAVNCAAVPETLLESELFGHEKGSFTGANKQHNGYFERAQGGTLFIDDIDDMPLTMQVKLLRFLQERTITRVGGTKEIALDLRIIAATKVDLRQLIEQKKFREDLFYRLNIIPVLIPPLRERKEDIPLLLDHFLEKLGSGRSKPPLTKMQLEIIENYSWPGNVRELENIAGRLLAMPESAYFIEQLRKQSAHSPVVQANQTEEMDFQNFNGIQPYLLQQEKTLILMAIKKVGQNISDAARLLKIPRSTLRSKMEKLKIADFNEKSN